MKNLWNNVKAFIDKAGILSALFIVTIYVFGAISAINVLRFCITGKTTYNEWKASLGSQTETDYAYNFWGKVNFVNLNGLMRNVLGQQEMNEVVKLNNGWLLTTFDYVSDETLESYADAVDKLSEYLEERGTPMLFALTPYTLDKYENELPTGVEDYGNDNLDRLMEMLAQRDVEYLDFREELHLDGLDTYSMMYKTDHHWTTRTGFYAYTKLLDWIQEKEAFDYDERVSDFDSYQVINYPKWHLGSRGQRVGIFYTGIDDFDLILPDFETNISNNDSSGSFEELLISTEPLKNRNYMSRYTYDGVLCNTLENYVNNNALNDMKILIVSDSMARAVNPYLVLTVRETRHIIDYDSHLLNKEYIEEYDPDIVILLYYPENALSDDSYEFDID